MRRIPARSLLRVQLTRLNYSTLVKPLDDITVDKMTNEITSETLKTDLNRFHDEYKKYYNESESETSSVILRDGVKAFLMIFGLLSGVGILFAMGPIFKIGIEFIIDKDEEIHHQRKLREIERQHEETLLIRKFMESAKKD